MTIATTYFYRDVNSVEQDCMRLDVWDFNPEESVNEKLNKINLVKDGRGLRKFVKETLSEVRPHPNPHGHLSTSSCIPILFTKV